MTIDRAGSGGDCGERSKGENAARAVAYLRVSTREQADSGLSLGSQRERVEAYAKLYDLDLVETVVDAGISGKDRDRPGLNRALGMISTGKASALIVVKIDRLTRSVAHLCSLVSTYFAPGKAALMSVSEHIDTRSAAGRLVLNLLASISQWESEAIGERTSVAMQHKRANMEYTGGPVRYGYRVSDDGVHLVEDEAEQAILTECRGLKAQGLSLRAISKELAKAGFENRRGRTFGPSAVRGMVLFREGAATDDD